MRPAVLISIVVATSVIGLACAVKPKAATTRIVAVPEAGLPVVFVTANAEQERVVQSLQASGIEVTGRIRDAEFLLTANLGNDWVASSEPCGPIRNVKFELRQNSKLVMLSKAKGWTGTCTPNVLDELSAEVARLILVSGPAPSSEDGLD